MASNGDGRAVVPKAVGYIALWTDQPEVLRDFFISVFHYELAYEDESVIVFDMESDTDMVIQRVDEDTQHLNGMTRFGLYADDLHDLSQALVQRGAIFETDLEDLGDGQALIVLATPTGHQVEIVGSASLGNADWNTSEEP